MPSAYWRKHKKPNVNLLSDSPFATDRQLEDQRFLIEKNRNPQGQVPGKNDKPRSYKIAAKVGVGNPVLTKVKVVNKIVREASGVHNYALVPPIVHKTNNDGPIDSETHPLMKPYREQSNRNPVMCSFGHRPRSASRTFHPGTMRIRLRKNEIADPLEGGKSGFGLPPSTLSQILHAPRVHRPGEELDDDTDGTRTDPRTSGEMYDPHDLFLPNEQIFEKTGSSGMEGGTSSISWGAQNTGAFSRSWNNTTDSSNILGAPDSGTGIGQRVGRGRKKKPSKRRVDDREWNNHFHVIERPSNEVFEMKKSGIAETQLKPLKERLTRFAAISVRDVKPDPFCANKKETDLLVSLGKPAKAPDPTYDKTANPFYDAEVEEDLRNIQKRSVRLARAKEKRLKRKLVEAAIKSIPKVDYHPDEIVIEQARQAQLQSKPSMGSVDSGTINDGRSETSGSGVKTTGNTVRLKSSKSDVGSTSGEFQGDKVYDHVMQPFDDYLNEGAEEKEKLRDSVTNNDDRNGVSDEYGADYDAVVDEFDRSTLNDEGLGFDEDAELAKLENDYNGNENAYAGNIDEFGDGSDHQ